MSRQKRDKDGARQEVRIIGGQWRRRKIAFADLPGLRPTADRVRETLFNWLQPELPGARVLDLFAGSGSLGFEALSRGAGTAIMIENALPAVRQLQETKAMLGAERAEILRMDALTYLRSTPDSKFQLVFIDPPFQLNLYTDIFQALLAQPWIGGGGLIYVESDVHGVPAWPDSWSVYRQLAAGNVVATLLRSL